MKCIYVDQSSFEETRSYCWHCRARSRLSGGLNSADGLEQQTASGRVDTYIHGDTHQEILRSFFNSVLHDDIVLPLVELAGTVSSTALRREQTGHAPERQSLVHPSQKMRLFLHLQTHPGRQMYSSGCMRRLWRQASRSRNDTCRTSDRRTK